MEAYLQGALSPFGKLAFEAALRLNPALRKDLHAQKKVHQMVRLYHRKKLKEGLENLHQQVFSNPDKAAFQQNIYELFQQQQDDTVEPSTHGH